MCVRDDSRERQAGRAALSDNAAIITVHVRYMSSPVRLSVCRLSVTFVRLTQAIEIFGDVSTPFGTLATR